jgi:peptide/nickel transport system substrate-binding protein
MKYTKDCMRIFKKILLITLAALLPALCACGSVPVSEIQGTIPEYTLPPVSEVPVPVQGGELTFPIPGNPESVNPLKIKNVELYNLFSIIYEQPVRIGVNGMPEPELAETWEVDSTGKVWTFHLRKGVKWPDGKGDFTSDDIIYTLGLIKSYSSSDSVYAQKKDIISEYAADDDYTVKITLKNPGNAAVYYMTFPVLCKSYCEGKNLDNLSPMGTGPYKTESYDKDKQMVLSVNSLWWKKPPYIQKLTAICYPDHKTELIAFDSNLVNLLTTSILTVDTYEKYGVTKSIDYLTQHYDCLVPNAKSGLFSDPDIRRAISLALDKREIVSKALLGHAVATDYPVSPDSYLMGGAASNFEYNLSEAAALFEKAGWKDRDGDNMLERVEGAQVAELSVKLMILEDKDDTYRRDVASNIASQLAKSGVNIVVDEEPKDAYMQALEGGNFELALCSFYLDQNPDISFMTGTGEGFNYGGFSDEEFDALLEGCNSALNDDDMKTAYIKMENSFLELAPQVSLYFKTNTLLYYASLNIAGNMSEKNVFTTIPQWYLYLSNAEK